MFIIRFFVHTIIVLILPKKFQWVKTKSRFLFLPAHLDSSKKTAPWKNNPPLRSRSFQRYTCLSLWKSYLDGGVSVWPQISFIAKRDFEIGRLSCRWQDSGQGDLWCPEIMFPPIEALPHKDHQGDLLLWEDLVSGQVLGGVKSITTKCGPLAVQLGAMAFFSGYQTWKYLFYAMSICLIGVSGIKSR